MAGGQYLSFDAYQALFVFTMAMLSIAVALGVWWLSRVIGYPSQLLATRGYVAFTVAASPLLLWRYDLGPAAITLAAVLAATRGRAALAGALLAFGTAMKLYPVVLVPVLIVAYLNGRDREALNRFIVGGAATAAAVGLLVALILPSAADSVLAYHLGRGLHVESVLGGFAALADVVGVARATTVFAFASMQIESPLSGALLSMQLPLFVFGQGALVVAAYRSMRRESEGVGLTGVTVVRYLAAAVVLFLVTNKVLSPQHLFWLLPFGPLLPKRPMFLLLGATALTFVLYPFRYDELIALQPLEVALLNVRNLALVAVAVTLLLHRPTTDLPPFPMKTQFRSPVVVDPGEINNQSASGPGVARVHRSTDPPLALPTRTATVRLAGVWDLARRTADGVGLPLGVLCAIPGFVYLATMLPDVSFGDWAEMQTVPPVLGIAHPTGYPTYTMLGWLWSGLPLGSVAWRMNLLSAVSTVATLAVLFLIMRRLGVRPWIACGAAMAFAFVLTVWLASTRAEVHTLHALFVSLITHRLLVWRDHQRPRDLFIGAALVGLSFTHHLLTATIAPFVIVAALAVGARTIARRPAILAVATLSAMAPLGLIAYLPIRAAQDPILEYGDLSSWGSVIAHVMGQQFRTTFGFLSEEGLSEALRELPAVVGHLASLGTLPVLVMATVGLAAVLRRRPAFALYVAAVLVVTLYLFATYIAADLPRYLLTAWVMVIVMAGVGCEAAAAWLGRARLVTAATFLVPAFLLISNFGSAVDVSERDGRRFADDLLAELPRDAVLITYWDAANPLWHRQIIGNTRRDVLVLDDTNLVFDGWAGMLGAVEQLITTRPVYVLRMFDDGLDDLEAAYGLTPVATVRVPYGQPYVEWERQLMAVGRP